RAMPRRLTRLPRSGRSPAKPMRPIRTGRLSPPQTRESRACLTMTPGGRRNLSSSSLVLHTAFVFAAFVLAGCVPMRMMMAPAAPPLRLSQVPFSELAGWSASDPQQALLGFRRSCGAIAVKADNGVLGGLYAGTAGDWRAPCAAAMTAGSARDFFEA